MEVLYVLAIRGPFSYATVAGMFINAYFIICRSCSCCILLTFHYKIIHQFHSVIIASKATASHLKIVLQNVVDNDQTGFLKGRSIAGNIFA